MTATLLALALLASTASHGKHTKTAKAAPKKAAATPLAIDPAAAKSAARALGLSAELVGRVEKYASNAEAVTKGGLDANVCSLVDESASLGADLHTALADRRPDPAKVAALEQAAPGLRVGLGPEGGTGGASFAALARVTAAKHPTSSPVLAGASGMLDSKRPAFIVMMKDDERGCTDYSRAQSSVDRLAASWKSAPACLKEKLKTSLTAAIADDELSTCWCQDQDAASASAKHYAAKLSSLKDFDGPGHAKSILADVDESDAHFKCNAQ